MLLNTAVDNYFEILDPYYCTYYYNYENGYDESMAGNSGYYPTIGNTTTTTTTATTEMPISDILDGLDTYYSYYYPDDDATEPDYMYLIKYGIFDEGVDDYGDNENINSKYVHHNHLEPSTHAIGEYYTCS